MALYKKNDSRFWFYSIYRGDGLPRLRGSTGKEKRDEAEAVEHVLRMAFAGTSTADRLHAMIDVLTGEKRDGLPLSEIWPIYSRWMASTGKKLAEVTERKRRRAVERFVAWAVGNWPAAKHADGVDRSCALGFAEWLVGQGTAGKTRRNVIGDLGTVWEGLKRVRDDLASNPWPLVLPEDDSERLHAFTDAQERAVMAAADAAGKGWGLACRLARFTGLRYGDIARLRWTDVYVDDAEIRLRPSKTARHGVTVAIPLIPALADELKGCERDGEFVLPLHAKFYPHPEWVNGPGAFAEVLEKAGLKSDRLTFHSWRHTFRSALSRAGVTDEIAKRLGGWTEDRTALRYDHAGRSDELRDAVMRGAAVADKQQPCRGSAEKAD